MTIQDDEHGPTVTRPGHMPWGQVYAHVVRDQRLKDGEVRLYAVLATYADEADRECFPFVSTLAEQMGCSAETVRARLRGLEAAGYLHTEARHTTRGDRTANDYVLLDAGGVPSAAPGGTQNPRGTSPDRSVNKEQTNQQTNQQVEPSSPIGDGTHGGLVVVLPDGITKASPTWDGHTVGEWFDLFWQHYPRKTSKAKARVAFTAAVKRGVHPGTICHGLALQVPGLTEREMTYRPHPATWLHQERWNDDPEALGAARGNPFAVPGMPSVWGASVPRTTTPATLRNPHGHH